MTVQSKTLYGVIAILIAIIVIVSSVAGLYYYEYSRAASENSTYVQQLKALGVEYTPDILLDYGNGSRTWYNNTRMQPGANLYVATQVITQGQINATYYPEYGSHFVTSIFNLANTKTEYWLLWTYNSTAAWQMASVGPDQLPISNGSVYAWTYCGSNCTAP